LLQQDRLQQVGLLLQLLFAGCCFLLSVAGAAAAEAAVEERGLLVWQQQLRLPVQRSGSSTGRSSCSSIHPHGLLQLQAAAAGVWQHSSSAAACCSS
jgi:hypothetical protein